MSRKLSERESAALKTIAKCGVAGADGTDLVIGIRELLGSISPADVTQAGVHQSAASLVRKNLAWRSETRPTVYRITQPGRQALAGDITGKWVAR